MSVARCYHYVDMAANRNNQTWTIARSRNGLRPSAGGFSIVSVVRRYPSIRVFRDFVFTQSCDLKIDDQPSSCLRHGARGLSVPFRGNVRAVRHGRPIHVTAWASQARQNPYGLASQRKTHVLSRRTPPLAPQRRTLRKVGVVEGLQHASVHTAVASSVA